jgi:hypothetical protein
MLNFIDKIIKIVDKYKILFIFVPSLHLINWFSFVSKKKVLVFNENFFYL